MVGETKPIIGYEPKTKKIIVSLTIDYSQKVDVDLELLFDVLKGADRFELIVNDVDGESKLVFDLNGALFFKDSEIFVAHLSNQVCVALMRNGKLMVTPYCNDLTEQLNKQMHTGTGGAYQ